MESPTLPQGREPGERRLSRRLSTPRLVQQARSQSEVQDLHLERPEGKKEGQGQSGVSADSQFPAGTRQGGGIPLLIASLLSLVDTESKKITPARI